MVYKLVIDRFIAGLTADSPEGLTALGDSRPAAKRVPEWEQPE